MICVVDDDPLVRSATTDLLNSLGHSAFAFNSAEEFLGLGLADETACLILDLIAGPQRAGTTDPPAPKTPIIFISALQTRNVANGPCMPVLSLFLRSPMG